MMRYIIKRILIAIPVRIGITMLDYLIMSMAGSPLSMMTGPRVSQAALEARAVQLGLTQPWYIQYFTWLGQMLSGNWGYSIKTYQPVLENIAKALGVSFNILEGVIGRIKDTPYGQLTVQVIGSEADVGRVEAAFEEQSIHCEVLGS